MLKTKNHFLMTFSLLFVVSGLAHAETHQVSVQGMAYKPLVVVAEPGDEVSWSSGMNTHNTQSIEDMIPEGAESWKSEMSQSYTYTFEEEGIYVYKCAPHIGSGMGGAIIVGEPKNLDEIKESMGDLKGAEKRLAKKAVEKAESM